MSHLDRPDHDELEEVSITVRGLFHRLDSTGSDPELGAVAVYDWEIADDTGLPIDAVRTYLQRLDGQGFAVERYGLDYRVTAIGD